MTAEDEGTKKLSFRELEFLPCARLTRFLTLDHARIARHQIGFAKQRTVFFVHLCKRAGNSQAHCAGLTRRAATNDIRLHIKAAERIRRLEWTDHIVAMKRIREKVLERPAIDRNDRLARARCEKNSSYRILAATDVNSCLLCQCNLIANLNFSSVIPAKVGIQSVYYTKVFFIDPLDPRFRGDDRNWRIQRGAIPDGRGLVKFAGSNSGRNSTPSDFRRAAGCCRRGNGTEAPAGYRAPGRR
jgi:hypothetical protein